MVEIITAWILLCYNNLIIASNLDIKGVVQSIWRKKLRVRKPSRIWYRTYQKIQGISHTTFEFANEGDIKIHWLLRRLENTMNMLTDALPSITQWSMSKHGFPDTKRLCGKRFKTENGNIGSLKSQSSWC